MRNPAMRGSVFAVSLAPREHGTPRPPALPDNRKPDTGSSAWRAMQKPPLSVLASNSSEHAHVLAVAILGYN
ncbi:hypothetical protein [Paraburkholderia aromaticivorans]|uniref:hypothetical protein n=1 Tax=Paraburkholderia aromaticivorans TaxID=2026199 RepID=UPI0038BACAFB